MIGLGSIPTLLGVAAGAGPSRLVTPLTPDMLVRTVAPEGIAEASRLSPLGALLLISASLMVGLGVLAWAFWWWRAKSESSGDAAFRVLALRMQLRDPERSLVRVLARERSVQPVALLVSVDFLREALGAARADQHEPARAWLLKRCGAG